MAPARRRSPEAPELVSVSLVPRAPPKDAPQEAPERPTAGYAGYNPYDTVKTRTADIWRFKSKRS